MVIAWWIKSNVERISILLINCCSIEYCHSNVLIMLTLVFIEFVSKILIELRSMHDSSRATWCTFQPKVSRNKTNLRWKKFLVFQKMELSSSNIKKTSYIFSKESFSYISEKRTLHFSDQAQKNKTIHPKKISYFSGNGNSKRIPYIFSIQSFSHILENGNFEKTSFYIIFFYNQQDFFSLSSLKRFWYLSHAFFW